MGIRISKKIGYFIPKASSILVPKFKDILDNLDEDSNAENTFFDTLITDINEKNRKPYILHLAAQYLEAKQGKLSAYNLINSIYFNDTFKGLLICSLDQHKAKRHDDLIDYYEAEFKDTITPINSSIYPTCGYIYKGGLESEMNVGDVCDVNELMFIHNIKMDRNNPKNGRRDIMKTGYFHPNIEPIAYMTAKAAGIIYCDALTFNLAVTPSIVSTWE